MNFLIPGFSDILDIIIVSTIIYGIIQLFKRNNGYYIIISLSLLVILYFIVSYFHLEMISGILKGIIYWILGLLVIFAPEIRRIMTHTFQRRNFINYFFKKDYKSNYEPVIEAANEFALRRMGALIVFEKNNVLDDYVYAGGEIVDSNMSTRALVSYFWPNSPFHDGALIIRKNRVYAAKVVLPLSKNTEYKGKFGTRHLAAIGITENTDSYCVVVSEQTGKISFAARGEIKRGVSPEELRQLLIDEERL